MSTLKSNFLPPAEAQAEDRQVAADYRTKALEAICGSMVFVEGAPLYWDIENED